MEVTQRLDPMIYSLKLLRCAPRVPCSQLLATAFHPVGACGSQMACRAQILDATLRCCNRYRPLEPAPRRLIGEFVDLGERD